MGVTSHPHAASSSSEDDEDVDVLLRELLELPSPQRPEVLADMCARFPEYGAILERRLDLLDAQGLLPEDEARATFGRFQLLRRLGGGLTEVHLALDPKSGEQVVLKILRHADLLPRTHRASLSREAMAASLLQHESIGRVLETGEWEGSLYLVLPFVSGLTLAQWIRRQKVRRQSLGRSDVPLVLRWLEQVARALHAAHRAGLVHRDVKPSNILIPWRGPVRLLDFGLCQSLAAGNNEGVAPDAGTLPYMAPELLLHRDRAAGPAADIHALGVTLFESLTLRLPYDGLTRAELSRAILTAPIPDPSKAARHLPKGLRRVIRCCLAKDAWDRYPSAAHLAEDLARLARGQRVSAPGTGRFRRFVRWCRCNPRLAVLAAITSLLILVLPVLHRSILRQELQNEVLIADRALMAIPQKVQAAAARAETLVPGWPDQRADLEEWLAVEGMPLAALLPQLHSRLLELDRNGVDEPVLESLRSARSALDHFSNDPRGAVALVKDRLAWAGQVQQRTIDDHAQAWRAATAAVLADTRYAGLSLPPQLDLVPLGSDPESGLQEFYHPRSAWSGAPQVTRSSPGKRLLLHDGAGIIFVLIPGGRVLIGRQSEDPDGAHFDPVPQPHSGLHEVILAPFFLAKFELTRGQWLRLAGDDPSYLKTGAVYGRDPPLRYLHPVESVSAERCDLVLARAGLSLPTESQWEHACGAGMPTRWSFGDDPLLLIHHANLQGGRDGFEYLAPVGSFAPNPFGLHDMIGNVSEWCRDHFTAYGQVVPRPVDGLRLRDGKQHPHRIYRGGSYVHGEAVRTVHRMEDAPYRREPYLGCRPARPVFGGGG